jgi:pimeloyl-ACP methyl ester carboxylesterase
MWDAPEEFNRVALEFLDEVEALTPREAPPASFSWGLAGWTNGIAHRQAGRRRDIVLVHGLGMSSAYLEPVARALFHDGWNPVAPDIAGFGESNNAPASGAPDHARMLASWADAQGIRDAVWLGHSIGCNAVAHLAALRPDLVRESVHIGPLWTNTRWLNLRTFAMLALDALREPLSLYRYVFRAYWRTGIARWWLTWRRFAADVVSPPPEHATFIAGVQDPLTDRRVVQTAEVPGAHACLFSHAKEVAALIRPLLRGQPGR